MLNYISKKLVNLGTKMSPTLNDVSYMIPDTSPEERRIIDIASNYTSTTPGAQWAFIQALKEVERRGVEGDIVECGVWKGGNLIIAGLMRRQLGSKRQVWGYDTFAGMTAPGEKDEKPGFNVDPIAKFNKLNKGDVTEWCYVPIEDVERDYRRHVGDLDVKLIKGKVQDTLPVAANVPEKIAVLRLDTDFYESTMLELELLYPRLQSGGVMIIDDYGVWAGSRRAVDEYFGDDRPWLHYVNRGVRLAVKP